MNEMTGLDPTQAKGDIEAFYDAGIELHNSVQNTFSQLFETLYDVWCSPNAEEFGQKHIPIIQSLLGELNNTLLAIVKNSTRAYNTIAVANGADPIPDVTDGLPFETEADFLTYVVGEGSLRKEKDGIVGMNVMQVNIALGAFDSNATKAIAEIEGLPKNIAFYDPAGIQKSTYEQSITKIQEKITGEVEAVKKDISTIISEETDTIMLAKQQSTETLAG